MQISLIITLHLMQTNLIRYEKIFHMKYYYDRKDFGVFPELLPFLIKTLHKKKPSESFLMESALTEKKHRFGKQKLNLTLHPSCVCCLTLNKVLKLCVHL